MAGQDVQADWHVQVLRRFPERLVMVGVERQVGVWRLPDESAFEAAITAAAKLLHRLVDVVDRDGGDADQPIQRRLAVLKQPVVVDAEAGLLQGRIVDGE